MDHGKTTLMDFIRGSAIALSEPGKITQTIGATVVPIESIKKTCGELSKKLGRDIQIPGLLFIDTPGHEAFTTLRKRGGAISDIAVLVVDVNEGFQQQTEESLNFLKEFRTPFVVAATKIDRLMGWRPIENGCLYKSMNEQGKRTLDELEEKIYRIVGKLGAFGFQSERYDRVSDFTKQVAIVPVSGVTGEGVPDLLMMLVGLAQRFLKRTLEVTEGEGRGTILEVKEVKGLGTTIDVILYDGSISKGDYLVIGGGKTIETRIKALLQVKPLKESRYEKDFIPVDSISAAAGIKISAPGIEGAIAGSPIRTVKNEKDVGKVREEVKQEVEEVEMETDAEGIMLKADALGRLEALIKILKSKAMPIKSAHVGNVSRYDVVEMKSAKEPIIFAFGVKVPAEIETFAKDEGVRIFSSDVIYHILAEYEKWVADKKSRAVDAILASTPRPGQIKVLPGYVFRQKNPAVFGVEVLKGTIKTGASMRNGKEVVGEIKEMQSQGENIQQASIGEKVAVSMNGVVVGKTIKEGDVLDVNLTEQDILKLRKALHKLRSDEKELLEGMI